MALSLAAPGTEPNLTIGFESVLSWPTTSGRSYQLQGSSNSGVSWTNLGAELEGDDSNQIYLTSPEEEWTGYQVLETIPGTPAQPASPVNGSFEDGSGTIADHWSTGANQPPQRSNAEAHTGSYSMHSSLSVADEGLISQLVVAAGGSVTGGSGHDFSFWAKQISSGPSYVQQYEVEWLNSSNNTVGSSGLRSFSGTIGSWIEISEPNLIAPTSAVEARIRFRFVTGAVTDADGEIFIDDITLGEGTEAIPDTINTLVVSSEPVSMLSWDSQANVPYQPVASTDLSNWSNIESEIIGDGGPKSFFVPLTKPAEFYRLHYPEVVDPLEGTGIVSLFNASTPLEPATTVDTPTALVTYIGDRARDRHAREGNFMAYDHYLSWYWEERSMNIEIVDEVAKGGTTVTFNYTTQAPLGAAEFRAFFRGIGTVAEYHQNMIATLVGPNQYRAVLNQQQPELRPIQIGDRIEIEISQFLAGAQNGRNNYYGTTMLYIVGQGIVPWEGITVPGGPPLDSYPLPENAWLGGLTTLPYQYSNEPDNRFKQMAGNLAPINTQPFLLGRRLHHTSFDTGSHSEPGNPIFTEHVAKLGNQFINRSCISCHTNNGRALPPAIGSSMLQSVVKVGDDANGATHPILGAVLQPQSNTGSPEGDATISGYTVTNGQYGDGTAYSLRKPNYTFTGTTPSHFSVRVAPQLVGLGLLEAISESTILSLADPTDENGDGISGRVQTVLDTTTGETRLGRFTSRASQPRLVDQIAAALNTDMGVTTSLAPILDGQTSSGSPELSDADLDLMNRYVALLGVGARRDLDDAQALAGEQIFGTAGCASCHTPTHTTSAFHPMTELRNQTIHPYTDLLIHDMGPGLADNMGEENASGSEWRTPPLWNIGLTAGVSGGEAYLHDGRARTLEEAILWHGGEAETSKENFRTLPAADRAALIKFLQSL
ncbi:MAG: di-heme oxidoredictase family protein [Roseibacillus sp.]